MVRVSRGTGLTLPAARAALTAPACTWSTPETHRAPSAGNGRQPSPPAPSDHTIAVTLTAAAAAPATRTKSTWWPIAVLVLGLLVALPLGLTVLHHLARSRARTWARQTHHPASLASPRRGSSAHPPSGRRPGPLLALSPPAPDSRSVAVTQENRCSTTAPTQRNYPAIDAAEWLLHKADKSTGAVRRALDGKEPTQGRTAEPGTLRRIVRVTLALEITAALKNSTAR